uniref:fructokinase n=1 Tax=Syphacia muris TaxID=451379 RepID=A0A0N5AR75_9BILA
MPKRVASVELGGETAAVGITDTIGSFLWKVKGISTKRNPYEAVQEIADTIKNSHLEFDAIGIASFGPVDLSKGYITTTPKVEWRNFPLIQEFKKHFPNIPITLDTDVNPSAYSEYLALKDVDPDVQAVAYLTVGTGVGLGLFSDGKMYHGSMHPEFGHISVKHKAGDTYAGCCEFHGDCIEGMISSRALSERLHIKSCELPSVPNEHPIWDTFAYYLAVVAANAAFAYAIDYFVVGGGIATGEGRGFIIEKAQKYCREVINGNVKVPKICLPKYSKDAGLVGAAAVALSYKN